jgi:hypothetical protein
MSNTNTGGPAFPRPAVFTQTHGLASPEQDGMTLRDYFAAKAMHDVMADWRRYRQNESGSDFESDAISMAEDCYIMADAMLKVRLTQIVAAI